VDGYLWKSPTHGFHSHDSCFLIADIVPAGVAVVERFGEPAAKPWPEELALIEGAVEKRQQEFLTGRECARGALARLGHAEALIPIGTRREPLWPMGVVGSITHCDGYCAAAAGENRKLHSIGIDAELDRPLPEGVLRLVATQPELEMIARSDLNLNADALLFSMKESVFKACYPLTGRRLDFRDFMVIIDPARQAFGTRRSSTDRMNGSKIADFTGRYMVTGGLICTTAVA
jgi:4'-phosphopantetheinyl transferase EntD